MKFPSFARFLIALCLFLTLDARAQSPSQIENSRQVRQSWVSDSANVLSDAEERRINAVCAELEKRTKAELSVVTVQSLGGKDVKEYANDLFRLLSVGKKGRDNGIIILGVFDPDVPAGQRKSHIEVGYGLEGELPDGKAVAILRQQIIPEWTKDNYGEGFYRGAVAVAQVIDPTFISPASDSVDSSSGSQPALERPRAPSNPEFPVMVYPAGGGIFIALLGLLALLFPILLFAGMIWFFTAAMRRPLRCSKCRAPVQQLSDTAELASLSPVQQFEQQIGARDYRVWHCQTCQNQDITAHDAPYSEFVQCPTCRHQTASALIENVRYSTPFKGGLQRVILSCQWPDCKHSSYYNRPTAPTPRGGYGAGYGTGYGRGGGGADLLTGVVLGSILGNSHQGGGWGSGGGYSGGDSSGGFGDSGGGFDSGPSDFGGGDSGGGGGSADW